MDRDNEIYYKFLVTYSDLRKYLTTFYKELLWTYRAYYAKLVELSLIL